MKKYCLERVHRYPRSVHLASRSLPVLAKFIVLTRSLSNYLHTHHQKPSLDPFEEVLFPSADHRHCNMVGIFVLSAVEQRS